MIRAKYIKKAKAANLAFKQSQPFGVPAKQEPDIIWTKDHRMICGDTPNGQRLYDVIKDFMWIRDGYRCCICGKNMFREEATFEHTDLRSGGHRNDQPEYWKNGELIRNGVAHSICNSLKGSQRRERGPANDLHAM